ncbi:MAG TPA: hypothetical protein VJR47_21250 [Stellaceae bacterium]|nr:hypothetical protein [Stellaceae bacterium]
MTAALFQAPRTPFAAVLLAALLAACTAPGETTSLSYASGEVGKTFALRAPRRVYACPRPIPDSVADCVVRTYGYFTLDNATQQPSDGRTILHLVFEDGRAGWMGYDDFLRQHFVNPVKLGLVARLGMSEDEIKASWGAPASIGTEPAHGARRQKWIYPGIGELYFEDGKLVELGLSRALPIAP